MTHPQLHRPIQTALSLLTAALALLAFASASQAKVVVDAFGFPGPEGGQFSPRGIATNQTGAGGVAPGTLYVSDVGPNELGGDANRIQRLDPQGHFERLWGYDVVQGGGTGFEICTVAAQCKPGDGSQTTANGGEVSAPQGIAVNQSTGNVYVLEWTNHRIQEFDPEGNFLRAFGRDVVSTGGADDVSTDAFEICAVASDCKAGLYNGDAGSITFGRDIAIDSAGNLWLANANNHRIEEFGANGNFIAAYGWDVDALGGSGGLEKCTSAATGACQKGVTGTELGQFGGSESGPNPTHMTVDATGFLYVIDEENNRIERFDPAANSVTLFAPGLSEETSLAWITAIEDGIQALPNGHFLLGVSAPNGDRLLDLDASGHLSETSLAGDGIPSLEHFALNEVAGTIYATVNDGNPGVAVIDDGPVVLPTAAIEPVSGLEAEGAIFNASVDPKGTPVASCKFQYSTDQVAWKDVPEPDCASLDTEGGSQALSESVGKLEPGTHYFVRFAASRYYHNEPVFSGEAEFITPSAPPLVSDVGAAQITDTSAYLAGEIKARSQSSEYHFEYGTSPALGSSTPTVGLTGSKQQIVSQQVMGLEPDATYYLRLVATNVAGATPSPTISFRTRPTPSEGVEQRAYEMVTPLDKNFSNAGGFAPGRSLVAADGEAIAYCMNTGFGDPPGDVVRICTEYRAARTASGWHTRWLGEPYCLVSAALEADPTLGFTLNIAVPKFSADLDFVTVSQPDSASCPSPPLDPAAPSLQVNLYRADLGSEPFSYDLLSPQLAAENIFFRPGGTHGAASDDWSHLVYTSSGQQTPDAPAGNFQKVFEWDEGALKLVSVDAAGNPFTTGSSVPEDAVHGVSADGSRIFFMTPGSGPYESGGCQSSACELYMRQNGTKTFDVSESECTSGCGESAADEFLAATPDGSKALFTSKAKLTNEDANGNGADLYLYTHSANPAVNKNLTLLSRDTEPADGVGAKALGLLGMSDDGETAYFAAEGQLVSGGPTAPGPKLYRWRANGGSPTLDYLATLSPQGAGPPDASNWNGGGWHSERSASREVTPDGKYLLINTTARVDRGADHDSNRDVYRWSEEDGWLCLSCQAPASSSAGESSFPTFAGVSNGGPDSPNQYRNVIGEDGARVLFTSSDALLPSDTNEHQDLYEWHENGTLNLISTGTDTTDVVFIGASRSLNDVFFTTFERLVGWDTDGNADFYDARVGGGFPEPPPTGAPCEGEACRGAPTSSPPPVGAGTAAFQGPGNVSAKGRSGKHHKKRHHKKRHRAAKHNRGAAR